LNQLGKYFDMSTRRNLRYDSAIGLMRGVLADHSLREDAAVARHQRDSAVVARRLKAQD